MIGLTRARIKAIAAVQGVYAALILSALQLSFPTPTTMGWLLLLASALFIEVGTLIAIYRLVEPEEAKKVTPKLAEFIIDVESIQVRFGSNADDSGTENVYRQWFSEDLSIDDTEFVALMRRGRHVRVAEYICGDGSRKIEGYYSLWPMSLESYESLKSGQIAEKDFHIGIILPIGSPAARVLYVSEICALSDKIAKSMLIKDMQRYVKYILKRSTNITHIATWGYTEVGRKIAVQMGLSSSNPTGRQDEGFYEIARADALSLMKPVKPFEPVWSVPT